MTVDSVGAEGSKGSPSSANPRVGVWRRAGVYLVSKVVQIAGTIFVGVFLTVLLASRGGQMENNARSQVDRYVMLLNNSQLYAPNQTEGEYITALRANLEHEAGLDLPFWQRQVKWTMNALRLDWGRAVSTNLMPVFSLVKSNMSLQDVLLRYLPNTVLLAGAANFLLFVLGIPLALMLARRYGSLLDRIFSMLVPVSSVPSWVIAILLISVFAVQLRILPVGGMFETRPPDNPLGYIPIVLRHMLLPVLAISVLAHALLGISLWVILAVVVLLNIFGSPTKTFRAAFLQLKDAPYIEAARAYGASSSRIILVYLLPRIVPVLVPQLVTLIPSYVFLEATLGMFNIKSDYPTWGTVIYRALTKGALWGAPYWVLEPLGMLLLTGLAFAMLGCALERILNPRLREQ